MLAESAVLGAFLAQDLALFVAFFDLMLIPFYFLIGVLGPRARRACRATIKLVIYTLVGSLLMLAAAVATGVLAAQQGGGHITFVLVLAAARCRFARGSQEWIFLFFAAAFLVKMPAFPLHGWMPDGYQAMPIEVLMVFSGVLSKVGAYGFLAIVLPLYPQAAAHFQTLMLLIALASILYGSVQSPSRQTDARLIAGYSSVAQLGFITLGIFALNPQGAQGALLQMVNHGLVVAPLLFIVALLAQRAGGSEDIREMGGIAFRAPVLATRLPGRRARDAGDPRLVELRRRVPDPARRLQSQARDRDHRLHAASCWRACTRCGCSSARCTTASGARVDSRELSLRDGVVLVPLIAVILFMALYPQLALHRSEGSVKAAVRQRARRRDASAERPLHAAAARPTTLGRAAASRTRKAADRERAPRDRPPERPARRLRGALAADRAARRRDDRAAGRAARARAACAPHVVPALSLVALGAARGADDLAVGRARSRSSSGALRIDDLALVLNLILIAGGALRGAAGVALARGARSGARRVLRAAADLDRAACRCWRRRRTRSRCSSGWSSCRSRCTCCARPNCAASTRWSRG